MQRDDTVLPAASACFRCLVAVNADVMNTDTLLNASGADLVSSGWKVVENVQE